jgi:hypothetical protein
LGFVTITHPHHPLQGQQLPIVCVRHGEHSDIIVRLPDGSHAAVAISATDYAGQAKSVRAPNHTAHLLDLSGLRQMAQFIDTLRQQGRFPDTSHKDASNPARPGRG